MHGAEPRLVLPPVALLARHAQRSRSVVLRDRFNQSLERVTWPEGLRGLGLDEDFDQTLDPSSLPNLEGLALGILGQRWRY